MLNRILYWNCIFTAGFLLLLSSYGCHKESFTSNPVDKIRIEPDTLRFDTVFTTIGSATRFLKIYNPNKDFIKIDRISILSGNASDFRLNVDGIAKQTVENVEIGPHDSIYLFCDVTVDPDEPLEASPFIKHDSILVEYNGNQELVHLIAWGQNANYYPQKSNKGQVSVIDLQGGSLIWNDPKPYILYGIVVIENGVLKIESGTQIHAWGGLTKAEDSDGNVFFYNDGRLIIGSSARIEVIGTKEKPVIFQGVRLEPGFKDIPGQWGGIFIDAESKGNILEFAVIKNNLIGIYIDSLAELKIANTRIYNNSQYGILSSSAKLVIQNCLLYHQGQSSLFVTIGGEIECNYSTFANLGNSEPAVYLSNAQCIDFPFCGIVYKHPLVANFSNCIITGSDEDELWLVEDNFVSFSPAFQNCLYRIKELLTPFPNFESKYTQNCMNYKSLQQLFVDFTKGDFHLDSLSVANGKAIPIPTLLLDLDCKPRDGQLPDLGCFEKIQ
ncbi:MAG: right-handed parallel beta-helix repeat-containing protein [Saprospiraceae bacterium]|nr:right-handed parallel beta-helix repeat-containing protein [Saprospiraceae bacterium]